MTASDGSNSKNRVSATQRIAAPAHAIFLLVSNPDFHVEVDGSAMLRANARATPLTAVGQTFDIDMDRRPLADTPNTDAYLNLVREIPDYAVRCTVTQLIPDRLVEWSVQAFGRPPAGHVWGWRIEPTTGDECVVTNYCDWTNISADLRSRFRWPVVPVDHLERSIDNLKRIAAQASS